MFVGITNTPRDYAWGSRTAIAELLGYPPSGGPEAELWLGAHPGSPSVINSPSLVGGAEDLAAWIAADPARALGVAGSDPQDGAARLPFLLKVLAAASPLSLQAHPTLEQARAGFERENAAGVPLDASFRNYRDALHKPELIFALSDGYRALCGFRAVAATRELLAELGPDPLIAGLIDRLVDDRSLHGTFDWLISRGEGVDALVAAVVAAASGRAAAEFESVGVLAAEYPGDPGIVISLLLNNVTLSRGEVLYLPAGNIHAYLSGLGIELMAASDNVLRGGLTPKHVDVPELLSVLDFSVLPVPYLAPSFPAPGLAVYRPDVPDFVLVHVRGDDLDVSYPLEGPAIALSIAGELAIEGIADGGSAVVLGRGDSVYITPDEGPIRFRGAGELFLATSGR